MKKQEKIIFLFKTAAGIPVGDNQNSITAGPRGAVLMQDFHLMEKIRWHILTVSAFLSVWFMLKEPALMVRLR
jgi:hypothetical protein